MNRRMIWRNLIRSKTVSMIAILFIATASMLLSLAAILSINLFGAVDKLMLDAKTPHFMQMHSGPIALSEIEAFAASHQNVSDFQILYFLNIDNAQIHIGTNSLADNVQDNGICIQSKQFDFLLDYNSQPVYPKRGELYVPICYYQDGTAKVGDEVSLYGQSFTVTGFLRDSQMNSTLASSKRFVVNEADYALLEPFGNVEYLIEFRLKDLSKLSAFETAYHTANLPADGPALTWPLFQMISAISDGIMIAVIVLIAVLVIFVALLCVRFTLLANIEDDYEEIGVMKALGMRLSDIRGIYLAIYATMAAIGSSFGFLLSLWLQVPFTENIRLHLGESGNNEFALLFGVMGSAFVFVFILLYVNGSLRRFRKISAVQAIRFGTADASIHGSGSIRLSKNKVFSANFLLGLMDILARKHLYITMLIVIMLASFIMIVPQNLYHTISGDGFVTYIGVGNCDLRLDIQQTNKIEEKTADIEASMKIDHEISSYALFFSKIFPVKLDSGTTENLKVELGDHTIFPLQYASGRMPIEEHEIALSAMNAEELGKDVGETITLLTSAGEKQLTISGIYSDITNGGKTAKAVFSDASLEAAWSVIYVNFTDQALLADKIAAYGACFPYAKISSINEYMKQTFGQTLQSVQAASLAAVLVSAAITLLVTLLFMKLLVAKDRHSISVLRAVGYTKADIRHQYAWRAVLILTAGILSGTALAGTFGEKLSAIAISAFGAATFQFSIDPFYTFCFSPLILLFSAMIATIWGTSQAGNMKQHKFRKE